MVAKSWRDLCSLDSLVQIPFRVDLRRRYMRMSKQVLSMFNAQRSPYLRCRRVPQLEREPMPDIGFLRGTLDRIAVGRSGPLFAGTALAIGFGAIHLGRLHLCFSGFTPACIDPLD